MKSKDHLNARLNAKEPEVTTDLDRQVRPVHLAVCSTLSMGRIQRAEEHQIFHRCISLIFEPKEMKPFFISHNFGNWNSTGKKHIHFKLYLPVSQFIDLIEKKKAEGKKVDDNIVKGVHNVEMTSELTRRLRRETFHWLNENGFAENMPLNSVEQYDVIDSKDDIRLVVTELDPEWCQDCHPTKKRLRTRVCASVRQESRIGKDHRPHGPTL